MQGQDNRTASCPFDHIGARILGGISPDCDSGRRPVAHNAHVTDLRKGLKAREADSNHKENYTKNQHLVDLFTTTGQRNS